MEKELKVKQPLHELIEHSDLNLLEAALPYIDQDFKQPLALYIKLSEMLQVMQGFQNEETLAACGLDDQNINYERMLQAMRMAGNKEQAKKIDQLIQLMNFSKILPSILENTSSAAQNQTSASSLQNQMELMKTLAGFMQQSQNTYTFEQNHSESNNQSTIERLMKDPRTASISPEKLRFIKSFIEHNQQKSPQEMLPQIMQLNSQMKEQGLSFEKNEMELLLDIMKESMTPEERQQIDMVLQLLH